MPFNTGDQFSRDSTVEYRVLEQNCKGIQHKQNTNVVVDEGKSQYEINFRLAE